MRRARMFVISLLLRFFMPTLGVFPLCGSWNVPASKLLHIAATGDRRLPICVRVLMARRRITDQKSCALRPFDLATMRTRLSSIHIDIAVESGEEARRQSCSYAKCLTTFLSLLPMSIFLLKHLLFPTTLCVIEV
jgi:hypothetical protein